jgi:hypothetical protein
VEEPAVCSITERVIRSILHMRYWLHDAFEAARNNRIADPVWSHGLSSIMPTKNIMENPNNPADGKQVVIQGGQRVTGALSQQEAEAEVARRAKLMESSGKPMEEDKRPLIKTNLFG